MRGSALFAIAGLLLVAASAPAAPRLSYNWAIFAAAPLLDRPGEIGSPEGSSSAALLSADMPLPLPYRVASLLADDRALSGGRGETPAGLPYRAAK